MDRGHRQINIVEELVMILDGHAGREEHHHLLLPVLLEESEEDEQSLLRGAHDVALPANVIIL